MTAAILAYCLDSDLLWSELAARGFATRLGRAIRSSAAYAGGQLAGFHRAGAFPGCGGSRRCAVLAKYRPPAEHLVPSGCGCGCCWTGSLCCRPPPRPATSIPRTWDLGFRARGQDKYGQRCGSDRAAVMTCQSPMHTTALTFHHPRCRRAPAGDVRQAPGHRRRP